MKERRVANVNPLEPASSDVQMSVKKLGSGWVVVSAENVHTQKIH